MLKTKVDFNGKTTTYAYDTNNRLLSKTPDPSFSAQPVSFTYYNNGLRKTMVDPSGTTSYVYDNRNRLQTKQTPAGTLNYTYDNAGDLLTLASGNANGASDTYTYDALNRLSTVVDSSGTTTYAYDNVGNLQSFAYPNGVTTAYTHDQLNRLTQMGAGKNGTLQANYVYTLGAAGNRLNVAELSGRTVNYGYDSLYRLTSEAITNDPNNHNNTTQYQYDNVGNRQQLIVNGTTANVYNYDTDDRLGSDQYDPNGNTISSAGTTSTYDFENHLISKGGVTIVYDGDGNRVSETVAGVTTQYLVETQNPTGYAQVVDEIQNGSVVRTYSWGLELISKLETGNSKRSFYGFDGHGSVRFLTDASGSVTATYDYDAFGNLINSTGSTPNNYLFAGEQFDAALGLYYNRARYYNNATGRFQSLDTYEGDPQAPSSLHKYVYVADQPVSGRDPSGLQLEDFGIAAAVEGVITAISVQTVGALAIAGTAFHYLPHDAFLKHPSGKIAGLQGSYPIGKLLAQYPQNPFLVGLAIGFQFSAIVGGVEILEMQGSTQPWLYGVIGLSIGVSDGTQSLTSGGNSPFNLNGFSFSAAYFGEAYNVNNPGDYNGPFYCVSASRGLGQFPGLPVGPNVSVCSSAPKADGTAGAYSWSISPLASKGFGVGTSILNYKYLFTLP